MGFCYLLKTSADVESFKVRSNIPRDINILYCYEGVMSQGRHRRPKADSCSIFPFNVDT